MISLMSHPFPEDPDSEWFAIVYLRDVNTVCRICLTRNNMETPVVTLCGYSRAQPVHSHPLIPDLTLAGIVCCSCYEDMQKRFADNKFDIQLPKLATLKLREKYHDKTVYCKLGKHTFTFAQSNIVRMISSLKKEKEALQQRESSRRRG